VSDQVCAAPMDLQDAKMEARFQHYDFTKLHFERPDEDESLSDLIRGGGRGLGRRS
jgi:hypothetical protein